MALQAEQKRAVVAEVRLLAEAAHSLVIADAGGIKVSEMVGLRKEARAQHIVLRVAKNTLARRAFSGTEFECAQKALAGSSLFAFSMKEPSAAPRLFKQFSKQNQTFSVRALAVNGRLLPGDQLDFLATLPSREEALARLLGLLQAPLAKLAAALQGVPRQLAYSLAAVREQKDDPAV